jgi:hypothetical protein
MELLQKIDDENDDINVMLMEMALLIIFMMR